MGHATGRSPLRCRDTHIRAGIRGNSARGWSRTCDLSSSLRGASATSFEPKLQRGESLDWTSSKSRACSGGRHRLRRRRAFEQRGRRASLRGLGNLRPLRWPASSSATVTTSSSRRVRIRLAARDDAAGGSARTAHVMIAHTLAPRKKRCFSARGACATASTACWSTRPRKSSSRRRARMPASAVSASASRRRGLLQAGRAPHAG